MSTKFSLPRPPAAWPRSAAPHGPIELPEVPNFGCVAPGCLYRAGQPSVAGYEWLVAKGLTTVVSLRAEEIGEPTRAFLVLLPSQHPEAQYLELPLVEGEAPTLEQAEKFLAVAADRRRWPILAHSHHGDGRAAVMAALVRYAFDGWPLARIQEEALLFRTDWHVPATELAVPGTKGLRPWLAPAQEVFLRFWMQTRRPWVGLKEAFDAG